MLFVPFAVVALRATLRADRALARGLGALARRRAARELLAGHAAARAAGARRRRACSCSRSRSATSRRAQVLLPLSSYTLGTEFQANSSTVAFAAAAPFAAVLIVLAFGAAYLLMSRFGRVRRSRAAERWPSCAARGSPSPTARPTVLSDVDLVGPAGHADGDPRRLRQRQDDAAAAADRLPRRRQRRRLDRRARRRRRGAAARAARQARRRLRRAGRRALPASDGRRERRLRPAALRAAPRAAAIDEALDLVGLDRALREQAAAPALGRRAAPGRARAGARAPARRSSSSTSRSPGSTPSLRAETRAAVLGALAAAGATAVLVTHDQAEALSMGREVAVLRAGRLVQTATPAALYRTPGRPRRGALRRRGGRRCRARRARARSCAPSARWPSEARRSRARLSRARGRDDQTRADPPATLGDDPAGRRGVAATVVGHSFFGPDTLLQLELADGSGTLVTARTHDDVAGEPGTAGHALRRGPGRRLSAAHAKEPGETTRRAAARHSRCSSPASPRCGRMRR